MRIAIRFISYSAYCLVLVRPNFATNPDFECVIRVTIDRVEHTAPLGMLLDQEMPLLTTNRYCCSLYAAPIMETKIAENSASSNYQRMTKRRRKLIKLSGLCLARPRIMYYRTLWVFPGNYSTETVALYNADARKA